MDFVQLNLFLLKWSMDGNLQTSVNIQITVFQTNVGPTYVTQPPAIRVVLKQIKGPIILQAKASSMDSNSRKWCKQRGLEEQRFYEMTKLRNQVGDIFLKKMSIELCFGW